MVKLPKIFPTAYLVLCAISSGQPIMSFISLANTNKLGVGIVLGIAFGLSSALILFVIYIDMEHADGLDKPDPDYPGWSGTFLESLIRAVIVLTLLLGVGEIAEVIYPYLVFLPNVEIKEVLMDLLGPGRRTALFEVGAAATFTSIFAYNVIAAPLRIASISRQWQNMTKKEKVHENITTFRIILFAIVSLICAVYWTIAKLNRISSDWAEATLLIYIICAALISIIKFNASRVWLESILLRLIDDYSDGGTGAQ